jgi:hypothetical protein
MDIKIHILDTCSTCQGQAYVPDGEEVSNTGERYLRHEPCQTCEGSGNQTRWISLDQLVDLIAKLDTDPMEPDYLELARAEPTSQYVDSRDAAGI